MAASISPDVKTSTPPTCSLPKRPNPPEAPPAGSNARKVRSCETLKNRWKSVNPTAFFSPSPRSTLNTSTKARPPSAPRNCSFGGLPGPSPVQVKNDPGSAFALWYCGQFQHPAGSTEGPTHLPPGTVAEKLL